MLQSMGSQRVRHNLVTEVELKVTQLCIYIVFFKLFSILVNHKILNIVPCVIQ